jgi:FkbM family methyltransferase
MFDKICKLKIKGYYPDTILDIGAFHGNWTKEMQKIFEKSEYYLFEAIDYNELNFFDNQNNIHTFNVLLSDKIEEVNWYQMKNTGDSIFREKTIHFKNCEIIKRKTIDLNNFCLQNNILQTSQNIFLKIDCQGAEINILKGASNLYSKIDFILLEMPLFGQYNENVPNFLEHIKFMDDIGFIPFDIVDNHYINDFNMQIDMVFIKKNHSFCNDVFNKDMVI